MTEIESTCSCADVRAEKEQVEPGERLKINGRYRSGLNGGAFRQRVTVYAAGVEASPWTLEIYGRVASRLALSQSEITLEPDALTGAAAEGTIRLTNRSDQQVLLQPPTNLPPGLRIALDRPECPPGESISIRVKATGDCAVAFSKEIDIPTTHATEPAVRISVQVKPINGVSPTPTAIRLGVVSKKTLNRSTSIPILIQCNPPERFSLDKVTLPKFLATAKPVELVETGLRIALCLKPDYDGLLLNGEIVIALLRKSVDGGKPSVIEVRIPISGVVSDLSPKAKED